MKSRFFIQAVVLSLLGVFVQVLFGFENAVTQLSYVILSLVIFLILTRIDIHIILKIGNIFTALGLLLLLLLLILADPIRGAQRWFVIGGFNLQPSVIFLPFFMLSLAMYLSQLTDKSLPNLIKTLMFIAIPMLLVFKQPDLGTALIIGLSLFSMTYLVGFPLRHYLTLCLIGLPFSFLFIKLLRPYQIDRLVSFINPNFDPSGINYNSLQSTIAIGSGFIFGKGFNLSSQSRLFFLPESHTDFVFAALAEAFGLFGSILVTGLLFFFFLTLLKEAGGGTRRLYRYYVFGLLSYLFFQTVFNIGMNLRLLPVVGVPLPFISYGGSSLLSNFTFLALATKLKNVG